MNSSAFEKSVASFFSTVVHLDKHRNTQEERDVRNLNCLKNLAVQYQALKSDKEKDEFSFKATVKLLNNIENEFTEIRSSAAKNSALIKELTVKLDKIEGLAHCLDLTECSTMGLSLAQLLVMCEDMIQHYRISEVNLEFALNAVEYTEPETIDSVITVRTSPFPPHVQNIIACALTAFQIT